MESLNLDNIIQDLLSSKLPSEETLTSVLGKAKAIIEKEANVLQLKGAFRVVGNINGHFHDLLDIIKLLGQPSESNNYLFLGDLVNRGNHSIESIALAASYKLKYPQNVFILRGKFENEALCPEYGLVKELEKKFPKMQPQHFYDLFNVLPLAAVVNESIFCVHGGLSESVKSIEDIQKLDRKMATPKEGPMMDLTWSDPSGDEHVAWKPSTRGVSQIFGVKPVEEFLNHNKLKLIVRSNQFMHSGFGMHNEQKVLTIFSAPNYCYKSANHGAVLTIHADNNFEIKTFGASAGNLEEAKKVSS